MQEKLYLYPGKSRLAPGALRSSQISFSQFSPRDLPDHPEWSTDPLLTSKEMDSFLKGAFEEVRP